MSNYNNVDFSQLPPNILQSLQAQSMAGQAMPFNMNGAQGQAQGQGQGQNGRGQGQGQGQPFGQMGMNMGGVNMGNLGNMGVGVGVGVGNMGMGNMGNMGNMGGMGMGGGGGNGNGNGNGTINMADFGNFGGNMQTQQATPNFSPAINAMGQVFQNQHQQYPQVPPPQQQQQQPNQARQIPSNTFVPPPQPGQQQGRAQMPPQSIQLPQTAQPGPGPANMYPPNGGMNAGMPARAPTPQNGNVMLPAQLQQQQGQGQAQAQGQGGLAERLSSYQRIQAQESQRQESARNTVPGLPNMPNMPNAPPGGINPQFIAQQLQQMQQGSNANTQQMMAHVQALTQQRPAAQAQQQQQGQGQGQMQYNLGAMMADLQQGQAQAQGQGQQQQQQQRNAQPNQPQGQGQGNQRGMQNMQGQGDPMVDQEAGRRQALSSMLSNNPSATNFTPSMQNAQLPQGAPPQRQPSMQGQQPPQNQGPGQGQGQGGQGVQPANINLNATAGPSNGANVMAQMQQQYPPEMLAKFFGASQGSQRQALLEHLKNSGNMPNAIALMQASQNQANQGQGQNQALADMVKNNGQGMMPMQGQGQAQGQGQQGQQRLPSQPQGQPQQQQQQGRPQQISVHGQTPQLTAMQMQALPHDKQLEQLQLMKDRQARQTGLITPQMQGGQLPLVSPGPQGQAQLPNQHTQRQQTQQQQGQAQGQAQAQAQGQGMFPQTTPQQSRAQLPSGPGQSGQNMPQSQGQGQGQAQAPQNPQAQQAAMMAMQQANRGPQQLQQQQQQQQQQAPPELSGRLQGISTWLRAQSDDHIYTGTGSLIKKISDAAESSMPGKYDFMKSAVTLILGEFKKRNLPMHEDLGRALVSTNTFGPQGAAMWNLDANTLYGISERHMKAIPITRPPMQQQQSNQPQRHNATAQTQQQQSGSAANPIEIGGSTPAVSVASLAPGQTPQMGYGQLPGQGGPPAQGQAAVRQPSFGTGTQQQPTAQMMQQLQQQTQQQQQQQQQRPPMPGQSTSQGQVQTQAGQNRPGEPNRQEFESLDFSTFDLPFPNEETLWLTLTKMQPNEKMTRPVINGQPVDLYKLFSMVHRTGGSSKLEANQVMWQTIAANCGFEQPNRDPNQPKRASPEIGQQVRHVYANYLYKLEDMLYKQMYAKHLDARQGSGSGNAGQGQVQGGQDGNMAPQAAGPNFGQMQMSTPNQQYAALLAQTQMQGGNIPPHLLESVAKAAAGNGLPPALTANLTDQQKRYIDDQRRLHLQQQQGQGQGQMPNRTPTMGPPITPTAANLTPQGAGNMMNMNGPHALTAQNIAMLQSMQNGMGNMAGMNGLNMGALQPGQGANTIEAQQAMLMRLQAEKQAQQDQQRKDLWNMINTIRNDVSLTQQYIKNRERMYTERALNALRPEVADNVKPLIVHELRSVGPVAREAKDKILRFFWLAVELKQDAIQDLNGLISHYAVLNISLQRAEEGTYINDKDAIAKIRAQFEQIWFSANQAFEQLRQTPEGIARLQQLNEFLARQAQGSAKTEDDKDKKPSTGTMSAGGQASASGAAAANIQIPKGLRMEDLKPPPAKRAKGKAAAAAAAAAGQSPAQAGQTPEAARTPVTATINAPGDSPVNTTSPARKAPVKRKRAQNTKAAKEEAAASAATGKERAVPRTPTATAGGAVQPPLQPPVFDENAAFFRARAELENSLRRVGQTGSMAGTGDAGASAAAVAADVGIWATLAEAVESWETTQQEHAQTMAALLPAAPNSAVPNPASTKGVNGSGSVNATGNLAGSGPQHQSIEDALFASWTNDVQLVELSTPDLYHGSLYDDDTSPESIKTVGSTTGLFFGNQASAMTGTTAGGAGTAGAIKTDLGAGMPGKDTLVAGEWLTMSPESRAYNGSLSWDDSADFDFLGDAGVGGGMGMGMSMGLG